jgi:hypothetical protein
VDATIIVKYMQKLATERVAYPATSISADSHGREFELLRLSARTVIDPETGEKIRLHLNAEIDWDFFVQTAHDHRVLPLIYRTFSKTCGDQVPKRAMEQLSREFSANARRNLSMTAELFQLLKVFEQDNIPAIPYKGPILSAALYGEVSMRQFSDLDVIVPKQSLEEATNLLLHRGYKEKHDASGNPLGCSDREKDLVLVHPALDITLELHWGISRQKDPLQVSPEVLWENVNTLMVGGKAVKIHTPEDLLLILCIHGGKHRWEHLGWLCDIAEIIRCYPELDWVKLIDRASLLGGRRILFLGLLLARNGLGAELPNSVVRKIETDPIVVELANQVQNWWACETPIGVGETEHYYMRLRESAVDKARVAVNQVKHYLMLTQRDREVLPLRGPFSGLLYVVRPFRLAWEYGLGPFWRFFKGTLENGSSK